MANALAHVAVGVLAGARTTIGPLTVAARLRSQAPGETRLVRLFQSDRFFALVHVGIAVELVLDKMPFVSDRTAPLALVPRMISGATSSAAMSAADHRSLARGLALGAAGAVAGAFATLQLRRGLQHLVHPLFAALAEDVVLLAASRLLRRS